MVTEGDRSRCLDWPSDRDSWLVGIDEAELLSPFIGRWENHIQRTHPQEEAVVDPALRRSGEFAITDISSVVQQASLEPRQYYRYGVLLPLDH